MNGCEPCDFSLCHGEIVKIFRFERAIIRSSSNLFIVHFVRLSIAATLVTHSPDDCCFRLLLRLIIDQSFVRCFVPSDCHFFIHCYVLLIVNHFFVASFHPIVALFLVPVPVRLSLMFYEGFGLSDASFVSLFVSVLLFVSVSVFVSFSVFDLVFDLFDLSVRASTSFVVRRFFLFVCTSFISFVSLRSFRVKTFFQNSDYF